MSAASREQYDREPWMTDDQWACACLLADSVGGFHHVMGTFRECGRYGVRITIPAHRLATYDASGLTTLVLLAHDRAIRVGVTGGVSHRVTLTLHRRMREETAMHARHPTIAEAVATHRKYWDEAPTAALHPEGHG